MPSEKMHCGKAIFLPLVTVKKITAQCKGDCFGIVKELCKQLQLLYGLVLT